MDKKDYLTTSELAKLFGISRVAVFKKIKKGEIKAVKIGRNYIIEKKDLGQSTDLSEPQKRDIRKTVEKTITEYGETLRLLGKE
jgi:excisionase family DNA binding protein